VVNVSRPPIVSRALMLVFVCAFGSSTSFYLLLSVVPLFATSVGASGIGAGLATAALMFATVGAELVTPRLVARFGYRLTLAAGLLLLGAPALALPGAGNLAAILAVSVVRGLGFAITVVVGSALVASLVPDQRRGEGLGLYGIVVGVPSVVALPLGVWLAGHAGFPPVFVVGAAASLAGLAVVAGLPGRQAGAERPVGILTGLRTPALLRPSIVFAGTTMAAGLGLGAAGFGVVAAQTGDAVAFALTVAVVLVALTPAWRDRRSSQRYGSGGVGEPFR
jgi:MFS family permease